MTTSQDPRNYDVHLVDGPSLTAEQRAAAELRFCNALEFALGGPHYVLPTLEAYLLIQALRAGAGDDDPEDDEVETAPAEKRDSTTATSAQEPEDEDDDANEEEAGMEAEGQIIALWEKSENDAMMTAFKPLGEDLGDARFEIVPR